MGKHGNRFRKRRRFTYLNIYSSIGNLIHGAWKEARFSAQHALEARLSQHMLSAAAQKIVANNAVKIEERKKTEITDIPVVSPFLIRFE